MSRTAIILKLEKKLFPNEGRYCTEMLLRYTLFAPRMPDEHRNSVGPLGLDFKTFDSRENVTLN